MKIFPLNFLSKYEFDGHTVEYVNFRELGQGGPEIGNIKIDDVLLTNSEYGGPLLYKKKHIYIPTFRHNVFYLESIHLSTRKTIKHNLKGDILLLVKIENNLIYYYDRLNNENLKQYDLSSVQKKKIKKWIFW